MPAGNGQDRNVQDVCFAFQQGGCKHGNACRYRHVVTGATQRRTLCFAFQKGECSRGAACKFVHAVEADRATADRASMGQSIAWQSRTRVVRSRKAEVVPFGAVNDRPPTLSMVPKRRFQAEAQGDAAATQRGARARRDEQEKRRRADNRDLLKATAAYKMLKSRRHMRGENIVTGKQKGPGLGSDFDASARD